MDMRGARRGWGGMSNLLSKRGSTRRGSEGDGGKDGDGGGDSKKKDEDINEDDLEDHEKISSHSASTTSSLSFSDLYNESTLSQSLREAIQFENRYHFFFHDFRSSQSNFMPVCMLKDTSFPLASIFFPDGFRQSLFGAGVLFIYCLVVLCRKPFRENYQNQLEFTLNSFEVAILLISGFSFDEEEMLALRHKLADTKTASGAGGGGELITSPSDQLDMW